MVSTNPLYFQVSILSGAHRLMLCTREWYLSSIMYRLQSVLPLGSPSLALCQLRQPFKAPPYSPLVSTWEALVLWKVEQVCYPLPATQSLPITHPYLHLVSLHHLSMCVSGTCSLHSGKELSPALNTPSGISGLLSTAACGFWQHTNVDRHRHWVHYMVT